MRSSRLRSLAFLFSASLAFSSTLPVAILFNTHADNNALTNIAVEVDLSNYQMVNGVTIPFAVQELLNGTLFLDITIQSATLNSGLSQSTFAIQ